MTHTLIRTPLADLARRAALVSAAVMAALAMSTNAEAQRGGGSITLYDRAEYQGRSTTINGEVPDLRNRGFNDMATSIRIDGGRWEVCLEPNFRGACQVIEESLPNMSRWSFNNRITSIRPVRLRGRGSDSGITLWSGPNATGDRLTVIDEAPDLRRRGFNDRARSVEVISGEWVICNEPDFRGACETVRRGVHELSGTRYDRALTSIAPLERYNRRRGNDGRGGYGGGYGSGGRIDIDGGRRTVFFADPAVDGYPVARCLGGRSGQCGQVAADAVCDISGYGRALAFGTESYSRRMWFLNERGPRTGRQRLVNVVCSR
ncbi:MAG: beta/gamma crystallin-related protein [Pseudomonadota bacterium]